MLIKIIKHFWTHPILRNEGGFGPLGAALVAGGSSLIGGLLNNSAQDRANTANKNMSREQMKFQERMSSTAHQRQVTDMKAAGLNPMLSANQTGASAPAGSMATMQAENNLDTGSAISSAIETRKLAQDLKNLKAQEAQTKAQTRKANTETTLLKANEPVAELKNQLGRHVQKQVQTVKSSAHSLYKKIPIPFEGYRMKKSEQKAKENYKLSPAARDAARRRKKGKK